MSVARAIPFHYSCAQGHRVHLACRRTDTTWDSLGRIGLAATPISERHCHRVISLFGALVESNNIICTWTDLDLIHLYLVYVFALCVYALYAPLYEARARTRRAHVRCVYEVNAREYDALVGRIYPLESALRTRTHRARIVHCPHGRLRTSTKSARKRPL